MTEQEAKALLAGLLNSRDAFTGTYRKAPNRPKVKRMSQRDREIMEAFRNRQ